jgi:carbon monoxide dehydrogenase subunit G
VIISVSEHIPLNPDELWTVLEPIEHHVEWMADAASITFTSEQRRGVGTRFTCLTVIGPIRLRDHMEVTVWEPGQRMGIRHTGLVTGQGEFTLAPRHDGTRFTWREDIRLPWWLGGALAERTLGRPILTRIWRGNLRRLRTQAAAVR